jgi:hypothetical protein
MTKQAAWLVARVTLTLTSLPLLAACRQPPADHALVVRHPESKCALIAFSGCAALAPAPQSPTPDVEETDAADGGAPAVVHQ